MEYNNIMDIIQSRKSSGILMNNNLNKKICLITGATSGIGKVTAQELANQGATVVINGRNLEKCQNTINYIKKITGNTKVDFILADLSSQNEVRKLADQFKNQYNKLDILINNAGVILGDRQDSVDKIEMTFAINHLSYYLLTNLLLNTIKTSAPSRIINVSSAIHSWASINFEDIESKKGYNGMNAYSQSKLANILFTYELARKLGKSEVTVNTMHPGLVATNLGANMNGQDGKSWRSFIQTGISPEEGAQTILYLATSPKVENITGKYFENKKAIPSSKESYDIEVAKKLWKLSAELVQ